MILKDGVRQRADRINAVVDRVGSKGVDVATEEGKEVALLGLFMRMYETLETMRAYYAIAEGDERKAMANVYETSDPFYEQVVKYLNEKYGG